MSTSLNPVPNAQVCVYLTVHITKLQLQTTFPKPLFIYDIPHVSMGTLAAENLDVCAACDHEIATHTADHGNRPETANIS
jgi:hypothetical protein